MKVRSWCIDKETHGWWYVRALPTELGGFKSEASAVEEAGKRNRERMASKVSAFKAAKAELKRARATYDNVEVRLPRHRQASGEGGATTEER